MTGFSCLGRNSESDTFAYKIKANVSSFFHLIQFRVSVLNRCQRINLNRYYQISKLFRTRWESFRFYFTSEWRLTSTILIPSPPYSESRREPMQQTKPRGKYLNPRNSERGRKERRWILPSKSEHDLESFLTPSNLSLSRSPSISLSRVHSSFTLFSVICFEWRN